MEIKTEIICKDFEQVKIINNKIYDVNISAEYYIIPLNKSFDMDYDDEKFKLTFKNQELWLKYSNHFKEIKIKDEHYTECVLIKSENIIDICVTIITNNYFRKNVWASRTAVYMNKKHLGKYYLVLPIIEDMIHIREFGEGDNIINIEMITNEILIRKVIPMVNHGCFCVTSNFTLNKDALFIRIDEDDLNKFYEK